MTDPQDMEKPAESGLPAQKSADAARTGQTGFGRRRRLGIVLVVTINVVLALAVWGFTNFLFTQPELRVSLDWSPGAKNSISDEAKGVIRLLRERGGTLLIDTFFARYTEAQDPGGIHRSLVRQSYELLERLDYLGGNSITVKHHDYSQDIRASRELQKSTGATPDSISLRLGKKRRTVHLVLDMADIDVPQQGGGLPGTQGRVILRGFKGEQALVGALLGMLEEKKELKAYWVKSFFAGQPTDRGEASGYSGLARRLVRDGFSNQLIDLETAQTIPEDCQLLILLQPKSTIGGRIAGVIHRYLRQGGNVLATFGLDLGRSAQLSFRKFLDPLGLRLGTQQVLSGVPDPTGNAGPRYQDALCERVFITDGWNRSHPATSRMAKQERLAILDAVRPLEILKKRPPGILAEAILTTSAFSWLEPYEPGKQRNWLPGDESRLSRFHVGAALEVSSTSAKDVASERKGRLAVLSGQLFVNGGGQMDRHEELALSLVHWLARRKARIDVPPRYARAAKFQLVPQQVHRSKLLLVYAVPGLFLILAFFIVYWRRRS